MAKYVMHGMILCQQIVLQAIKNKHSIFKISNKVIIQSKSMLKNK